MRKQVLLIFLLVLSLAGCRKDEYICENGFCRGPYVQLVGQNSAVIRWRSLNPVFGKVKILSTGSEADFTVSETIPGKDHEVKISGLTPDSRYYYQVENQEKNFLGDDDMYFHTAPAKGSSTPVRFWVIGDAGTGFDTQNNVRDGFLKYAGNTRPDLWFWLGDNAYNKGEDEEYQANVFTNHYEKLMRNIPVYPVPGNHDFANCGHLSAQSLTDNFAYFKIFSFPILGELGGFSSGTKHYYSMDYSNIHFVFLDSYGAHNTPGSPMYSWLEKDLAANNQKWLVVLFHHPPYTRGSHDSDTETELKEVRTNLIPLLEANGADLVLSGHSHTYERSFFINGHTGNSDSFTEQLKVQPGSGHPDNPYKKQAGSSKGTVYVVNGSGGKTSAKQGNWPHPAMYYSDNTNAGSMCIDTDGNMLKARFIGEKGQVLDEFAIEKNN